MMNTSQLQVTGDTEKKSQLLKKELKINTQEKLIFAENALKSQIKIKEQLRLQQQSTIYASSLLSSSAAGSVRAPLLSQGHLNSIQHNMDFDLAKAQIPEMQPPMSKSPNGLDFSYLSYPSINTNESMISIKSEQQLCQSYNSEQHSDYIISDYMDKIATRISLLETELKFAWRALDLLSTEYGKIWIRLEKLENISIEQQSVVGNLVDLIGASKKELQKVDIERMKVPLYQDEDQLLPLEMEDTLDIDIQSSNRDFDKNLTFENHEKTFVTKHTQATKSEELMNSAYAIDSHPNFENIDFNGKNLDIGIIKFGFEKGYEPKQKGNQSDFEAYKESRTKLYSDSDLMLYERQQFLANSARAELMKEFLNGRRVLNEISASSGALSKSSEKDKNLVKPREPLLSEIDDTYVRRSTCELVSPSSNNFFQIAASKTGEGGNQVLPIEDTGGTESPANINEVDESFYKNLNEAYRDNELSSEIFKVDALLHQSEATHDHISFIRNQSTSSPVLNNQRVNAITGTQPLQTAKACLVTEPNQHLNKEPRKHRKKKHHTNEMDMINKLKCILAQAQSTEIIKRDIEELGSKLSDACVKQTETENKSDNHISTSYLKDDIRKMLNNVIQTLLGEINKIKGLQSLSATQLSQLQNAVWSEERFFQKISLVDKKLTLLLLNPLTVTEELQRLCISNTNEKFVLVIKKLKKNIDTLKKLVGSSLDDFKIDNSHANMTTFHSLNPSHNSNDSSFSAHLLRNNSNLDEQLKILETQEIEIHRKKKIDEIVSGLSEETYTFNPDMEFKSQHSCTNSTDNIIGFPKNIYNEDEYIKSLRKSLERHNSMIFLLHLQNPEKHKVLADINDAQMDSNRASLSPPPPAPTDTVYLNDAINQITYQQRNGKSDSGLSSMSGWSANSQVSVGLQNYDPACNNILENCSERLQTYHSFPLAENSNFHSFPLSHEQAQTTNQTEFVILEENLNYIYELSKNLPICSAYENKSIFDMKYEICDSNEIGKFSTVDEMLEWDQLNEPDKQNFSGKRLNSNLMPDLLTAQIPNSISKHNKNTSVNIEYVRQKENKGMDRRSIIEPNIYNGKSEDQICRPCLTDKLVFYPSSNSITDHNSSHDFNCLSQQDQTRIIKEFGSAHLNQDPTNYLDYTSGTYSKAPPEVLTHETNSSHLEFNHESESLFNSPNTSSYCKQKFVPGTSPAKPSKVWKRLNTILADNLKLKRVSKFNRSLSLPGDVQSQGLQRQPRGQAGSCPFIHKRSNLAGSPVQLSKRIQKLPIRFIGRPKGVPFVRRSSSPDSAVSLDSAADKRFSSEKGLKKKTISSKMSGLMQKAKTYKRHSFVLRRGCNMSDSELEMPDFVSSGNDNSSISTREILLNQSIEVEDEQEDFNYKNRCDSKSVLGGSIEKLNGNLTNNLFPIVGDLKKIQSPLPLAVLTEIPSYKDEYSNKSDSIKNSPIEMPKILIETACNQELNLAHSDDDVDKNILANSAKDYVNAPTFSILKTVEDASEPTMTPLHTTTTTNSSLNVTSALWVTQQCLDLPNYPGWGSREDDDNRSQHSARTLSSSRRQSTEDSIDTDDEYFYYELRQLEEQEKQRAHNSAIPSCERQNDNDVLFSQIGQLLQNDVNGGDGFRHSNGCNDGEDAIIFSPSESVKLRMSEVFKELKSVVSLNPSVNNDATFEGVPIVKPTYEKLETVSDLHSAWQDVNGDLQIAASDIDSNEDLVGNKGRETPTYNKQRKLRRLKKKTRDRKINISKNATSSSSSCHSENECNTPLGQCTQKSVAEKDTNDISNKSEASSETSGPDTPAELSDVDISETENGLRADDGQNIDNMRGNSGSLLKVNRKYLLQFDVDHSLINQPLETSQYNTHMLENITSASIPSQNRQIDSKTLMSQSSHADGSQAVGNETAVGLSSSKWKLLKTLKERKIEEKNNQDKIKEDEMIKDRDKVIIKNYKELYFRPTLKCS